MISLSVSHGFTSVLTILGKVFKMVSSISHHAVWNQNKLSKNVSKQNAAKEPTVEEDNSPKGEEDDDMSDVESEDEAVEPNSDDVDSVLITRTNGLLKDLVLPVCSEVGSGIADENNFIRLTMASKIVEVGGGVHHCNSEYQDTVEKERSVLQSNCPKKIDIALLSVSTNKCEDADIVIDIASFRHDASPGFHIFRLALN